MLDLYSLLYGISVWALPAVIAITFHEAAHGFVAWRLGDDTAYRLGRVTFNPLKHIDPVGTILVPGMLLLMRAGFLFGWAKPVPVSFGRLRNPRRDMILVAAAGPGINFVLAFVSALAIHLLPLLPPEAARFVWENLQRSVFLNVLLAVFNLLPLPPLDGGRILVGLLPYPLAAAVARLERFGFLILIGLVFILPLVGQQLGIRLDFFARFLLTAITYIQVAIELAAGLS